MAREKLGWIPEITLGEMVKEMVETDLEIARCHVLLKENGYEVPIPHE